MQQRWKLRLRAVKGTIQVPRWPKFEPRHVRVQVQLHTSFVFLHAESQCPGPFRRAVSETTPPTRPLPPTPRESQPPHVGPLPMIFILRVSLSYFSPNPHPLTSSGADPPFRFPLEQKVTFHQGYVLLLRIWLGGGEGSGK